MKRDQRKKKLFIRRQTERGENYPMSLIKRFLCFMACVSLLAVAANAGPVTLYNNIGADYIGNGGEDPIDTTLGIGPIADSFSTGSSSVQLTDLKLLLMVVGTPNPNAVVTITLNSDSATTPGAVLTTIGSISDSSLPVGPPGAVFDFPVSSFSLAANTRYWIELSTNDGSSALLGLVA